MVICDKDTGRELSIFEAQKLKEFGKSDKDYLDSHLKLKFKDLADSYCKYVGSGKSAPFTTVNNRQMGDFCDTFLRCFRVGYNCGGTAMNVYHMIVRVAK